MGVSWHQKDKQYAQEIHLTTYKRKALLFSQHFHKSILFLKGYLQYKTITSQNVSSEIQIKNFFIS